jgi:hypothetical protein
MDTTGESTSRVACSSSLRRPRAEASPRRIGETGPKPSLDSRLIQIWVVLAHHGSFCALTCPATGVDDSRETATVAVARKGGVAVRG